jgi:hypothetical protein
MNAITNMKTISLMIYAGSKPQYIFIDQIAKYFINTFNIDPEDCLVQVLKTMQKILGKRNLAMEDTVNLKGNEQSELFKEAINDLIASFRLFDDQAKIYFECIRLYKEWRKDFED